MTAPTCASVMFPHQRHDRKATDPAPVGATLFIQGMIKQPYQGPDHFLAGQDMGISKKTLQPHKLVRRQVFQTNLEFDDALLVTANDKEFERDAIGFGRSPFESQEKVVGFGFKLRTGVFR